MMDRKPGIVGRIKQGVELLNLISFPTLEFGHSLCRFM